jgi:hypothetical protein
MAAIAFDTLKASRRLIAAGMPTRQAEAQAEVMAEAFIFNVDSLVTKDYLDARLGTLEANMDGNIGSLEAKLDRRIDSLEAKLDGRVDSLEAKLDGKIDFLAARMDGKFRLIYWMLAVVIAGTTVPALHGVFGA